MSDEYPMIEPKPKSGDEPFIFGDQPTGDTLVDFWSWTASDLLSNATRGILAEFLVARALGLNKPTRAEWDSYDLDASNGLKIEVKSSAYVQSWFQKKPSAIRFSIRPTKAWNPATGEYASESRRQANVYVFCLLDCKDQNTIDPMNLNQWRFFILPTAVLNRELPSARQVSLSRLLRLEPHECRYSGLREAIQKIENQPVPTEKSIQV